MSNNLFATLFVFVFPSFGLILQDYSIMFMSEYEWAINFSILADPFAMSIVKTFKCIILLVTMLVKNC